MKEQQEKYNLPRGWIWVTIGDIAILSSGGTPDRGNRSYFNGDIPWVKSGELNHGIIISTEENITLEALENSSAKIVPSGTLLIALYGSTVGKLAFLGIDAATNQAIAALKTTNSFKSKYLYYYLLHNRERLLQKRVGGAQPNISQKILEVFPIPLSSLQEQDIIVHQIESLFSKLDEAEKGLKKANNSLGIYRLGLLKSAFNGVLTKNWREDLVNDAYQELTDIKIDRKKKYEIENKKDKKIKIDYEFDYKRDDIINSWAVSSLDNLININARIGWRGLTKKEYTHEGALFLSVHSLNYGKNVVFKDVNFISIERYNESPEIKLKENDILLCKDGAGIGKVGIIKKLPDIATVNSSLLVIDSREIFNPDFLYYFFLGPDIQRLVNEKISGSAIPHLFQKDIKKFKLKVPPKLEQDKIVEILESRFTLVDNLEKTVDNVLNEIIVLKHSILKKAFEGRLVNYNSNESVENLLTTIQEEKRLYLENQKKLNYSKPKQKKQMEEKKSLLDILKESSSPISAQELWEKSTSEGDIERFYSEIKEIYHQIDELKTETESLLTIKDENK
ncbi:restriction endonuclease subunit S [Chryseobacterium limigenitum]|uniref:Type I restriction enzyme, S subunit n=1 Tax=Chryseobacterium limigenitum TaxID=1612149 RepID=A0A1K2IXN3_9FLAO|nr:restriction endonuclease subunit S [Chryseobacterium limigenitum]SFZ97046.1 type I restriction enzyme, S subunit [Chryseobacterium limigenitum]